MVVSYRKIILFGIDMTHQLIQKRMDQEREILENELINTFREKLAQTDIEKLRRMRVKDLENESKQPLTEDEKRKRQRAYQKKYRDKNREEINERKRRARLGQRLLPLVPDHIVIVD